MKYKPSLFGALFLISAVSSAMASDVVVGPSQSESSTKAASTDVSGCDIGAPAEGTWGLVQNTIRSSRCGGQGTYRVYLDLASAEFTQGSILSLCTKIIGTPIPNKFKYIGGPTDGIFGIRDPLQGKCDWRHNLTGQTMSGNANAFYKVL